MKHLKLFESFEIVEPIEYGEPLNNREINFLKGYNVMCPELILKDDNYYYVFNHRCENIKDVPDTYIHAVCKEYYIENYTINDDYSIDVDGKVDFFGKPLTKLPFIFNVVMNFDCSANNLTTLEGSPKRVSGYFYCNNNNLTTLEGSPKRVSGYFDCSFNKLTTLEGGPEHVGGYFDCSFNKLTTLEGSPEHVGGDFDCSFNKLTTLEGSPEHVGGDFYCADNKLTSVKYKGIIKGELIYNISW
jgi:hypothetical protein